MLPDETARSLVGKYLEMKLRHVLKLDAAVAEYTTPAQAR
jgi:hypothetical protein